MKASLSLSLGLGLGLATLWRTPCQDCAVFLQIGSRNPEKPARFARRLARICMGFQEWAAQIPWKIRRASRAEYQGSGLAKPKPKPKPP